MNKYYTLHCSSLPVKYNYHHTCMIFSLLFLSMFTFFVISHTVQKEELYRKPFVICVLLREGVRRPSFHKHCWASIIKDLIDQSAMSVPDLLLGAIIRQNQIQALMYLQSDQSTMSGQLSAIIRHCRSIV